MLEYRSRGRDSDRGGTNLKDSSRDGLAIGVPNGGGSLLDSQDARPPTERRPFWLDCWGICSGGIINGRWWLWLADVIREDGRGTNVREIGSL